MKRLLDITIAAVALIALWPLLAIIALLIRLEGAGPVLFRQLRLGRNESLITLHKFRTLREVADVTDEVTPSNDPRITRMGAWLRRYRLDELPQFFDVLAGRLSLVGPRPQTADNMGAVDLIARRDLLRVRPGLTSITALNYLAEDEVLTRVEAPQTVYRRVLVPIRVADDLRAAATQSIGRDLMTLLRTPFALCSKRAFQRSRTHVERVLADAGVTLADP